MEQLFETFWATFKNILWLGLLTTRLSRNLSGRTSNQHPTLRFDSRWGIRVFFRCCSMPVTFWIQFYLLHDRTYYPLSFYLTLDLKYYRLSGVSAVLLKGLSNGDRTDGKHVQNVWEGGTIVMVSHPFWWIFGMVGSEGNKGKSTWSKGQYHLILLCPGKLRSNIIA